VGVSEVLDIGDGRDWTRRTSVGVELGVVEVAQDVFDGLDGSVPLDLLGSYSSARGTHCRGGNVHLEVASDKELATHIGGILDVVYLRKIMVHKVFEKRCKVSWCCSALSGS
jgi:hypothetical protein